MLHNNYYCYHAYHDIIRELAIGRVGVASYNFQPIEASPQLLNMQADPAYRLLLLPKKVFGVGSRLHSINISAAVCAFLMTCMSSYMFEFPCKQVSGSFPPLALIVASTMTCSVKHSNIPSRDRYPYKPNISSVTKSVSNYKT